MGCYSNRVLCIQQGPGSFTTRWLDRWMGANWRHSERVTAVQSHRWSGDRAVGQEEGAMEDRTHRTQNNSEFGTLSFPLKQVYLKLQVNRQACKFNSRIDAPDSKWSCLYSSWGFWPTAVLLHTGLRPTLRWDVAGVSVFQDRLSVPCWGPAFSPSSSTQLTAGAQPFLLVDQDKE